MDLKITFGFKSRVWWEKRFLLDDSDVSQTPKKIMMRFYMFSNSSKSDFNFNFYFSSRIDRKRLPNDMLVLAI